MVSKQFMKLFGSLNILFKLLYKGFGNYKKAIIILMILGFGGGILEGIGINALIPLFSLVIKTPGSPDDRITVLIQRFFGFFNLTFSLKYLLIFIFCLFLLRAVVLILSNYLRAKVSSDYEELTRTSLLSTTFKANWGYLLGQRLGYLETILVSNVRMNSLLLENISMIASIITSLLIYLLVAINISFWITIIAIGLGLLTFVITKPIYRWTRAISREAEKSNRAVSNFVNENTLGMKTVKVMGVGEALMQKAKVSFEELSRQRLKMVLLRSSITSLIEPVGLIFVCIIFAVSYKLPNFNFATLAATIYLIQRIFTYVGQLQSTIQSVIERVPFLESVLEYQAEAAQHAESGRSGKPFHFNKTLEFRKVSFEYGSQSSVKKRSAILKQLDITIGKGETIGLVGPSGGGKTTTVDLILRLFKPTSGQILLDGIDSAEINLSEWRSKIGYVSQDIYLINDTIENNIRFYNESITESEIIDAAKKANIYDFIIKTPQGFKTVIGERGVLLSSGQRQRVIIARVLAKKAEFLILDEATSALDNESEYQIQEVIKNLKGTITVFMIAHRLSTVMGADRILVLQEGMIVESGEPKALLADKESYFYKVNTISV